MGSEDFRAPNDSSEFCVNHLDRACRGDPEPLIEFVGRMMNTKTPQTPAMQLDTMRFQSIQQEDGIRTPTFFVKCLNDGKCI